MSATKSTDPLTRLLDRNATVAEEPVVGTETGRPELGKLTATGESSSTGSGDQDHALLLSELTPVIESARAFAEHWEEQYRTEVFRAALEQLLSFRRPLRRPPGPGEVSLTSFRGQETRPPGVGRSTGSRGSQQTPNADGADVYDKLSRALDLDRDSIERVLKLDDSGEIHILARLDGKTKKDLQTKYSLVYLYVKEVAFGERMVDVEALRSICIEYACYDVANFTGNFAKDARAGLIRQQGEKGTRNRKFLLSKKGLDEAAAIVRDLAAQ